MDANNSSNFDERLQAIAQTLGLVAGMQLTSEKRIDSLARAIEIDAEHIRALMRIADVHEQ